VHWDQKTLERRREVGPRGPALELASNRQLHLVVTRSLDGFGGIPHGPRGARVVIVGSGSSICRNLCACAAGETSIRQLGHDGLAGEALSNLAIAVTRGDIRGGTSTQGPPLRRHLVNVPSVSKQTNTWATASQWPIDAIDLYHR
jgi:hypothetical protein